TPPPPPPPPRGPPTPPGDAGEDAPFDAGIDAPIDAGSGPLCPPSANLIMCHAFDGNTTDGANGAVQPSASNGITYVPGHSGQAARFAQSSPSYIVVPA